MKTKSDYESYINDLETRFQDISCEDIMILLDKKLLGRMTDVQSSLHPVNEGVTIQQSEIESKAYFIVLYVQIRQLLSCMLILHERAEKDHMKPNLQKICSDFVTIQNDLSSLLAQKKQDKLFNDFQGKNDTPQSIMDIARKIAGS